jgi:hypothetical protein
VIDINERIILHQLNLKIKTARVFNHIGLVLTVDGNFFRTETLDLYERFNLFLKDRPKEAGEMFLQYVEL